MPARFTGAFSGLEVPLGLSLPADRKLLDNAALEAIRPALDYGIRLFVADAEPSHGRFLTQALERWNGPRSEVRIATRVALPRSRRRSAANAAHLRKSVEESVSTLGCSRLFLLLLDVDGAGAALDDSLGLLADLQRAGKIEHFGLCNVTANELSRAEKHCQVAAVENELSVMNRQCAADGLVMLTQERGITFLARDPLGSPARLAKNRILAALAQRHHCSPEQIALASLLSVGAHVVPLIGASNLDDLRSCLAATQIALDVSDRTALEFGMSFTPAPERLEAARKLFPPRPVATAPVVAEEKPVRRKKPRQRYRPVCRVRPCMGLAPGLEVVVLIGIQGAGKSSQASVYEDRGYLRLHEGNRLVHRLQKALAQPTSA